MKADLDILKRLSEAYGPPNSEDEVKTILKNELNEFADSVREDRLGNIFFHYEGEKGKPLVMLAAHMDEVAFMVTHIEEKGFLRFHTLGGMTVHVMPGQRIIFRGAKGNVQAIIGTKPPHIMTEEERKNLVPMENLFVDVGARNKEEVIEKGIDIGTIGVFDVSFTELGKGYVMGKAFDDRAGCAVMAHVFKKLKGSRTRVVAVGTVQEEVGLRGARVAAWQLEPDYGLALEGSFTADVPGSKPHQISAKLCDGPIVTIADRTTLTHPKVLRVLVQTAKNFRIPFQFKKIPKGGTDAGSIHLTKAGVPSGTVAVPCRYIHGPASILY
ncbi:MAG: M42 family metallopeptidase, partial [Candidatus Bathyarchaeota archaeon]